MKYFTPRGTEIKEFNVFVGDFYPEEYSDVMSRAEFLEATENGHIMPCDGTLGEIIVDGKLTCYELEDYMMGFYMTFGRERVVFRAHPTEDFCYRIKSISMEQFRALEGNVQVCWYNK